MSFSVQLEVFDGPLDLLLTLVRRESLEITTVALAKVTDQFLTYLRALEAIDAFELADFCEIAATLMLIKSRALLPRERARALDEEDIDGALLAARLEAYRRYKEVAGALGEREERGMRAFARVAPPPKVPPRELEPGGVDPAALAAAFRAALAAVPVEDDEPATVRPHRVRIADRLASIRDLLRTRSRVTFVDVLTDGPRTREFVIVSFLAVLELLRRAAVLVRQDELFGEIVLEVRSADALETAATDATFLDEP